MAAIHFLSDNKTVEAEAGETILQAALRAGIRHTHVCGGKARCTTCRVMLIKTAADAVSARTADEAVLANRLGFDHNIRLACQCRVNADISVRRLVIDDADIALTKLCTSKGSAAGMEKTLAILFADIRDFTGFSERQLPYDVIHLLNRYFFHMRRIIEANHGQIYNYMGDGLLALFGVEDNTSAADDSVRSALQMLTAMDEMQAYLLSTYGQNLHIGIGLHYGELVIGSHDDSNVAMKMVIGDAVNYASRVESANKVGGTRLLVSQQLLDNLQLEVEIGQRCLRSLKGLSGEHPLYEILALA